MRFAIFGNPHYTQDSRPLKHLLGLLKKRGAEIYLNKDYRKRFPHWHSNIQVHEFNEEDELHPDIVISMGGDGTFLRAAQFVGNKRIPIIGINTGRLGFLADFTPEELETTLDQIYRGDYDIEERSVLQVSCNGHQLQQFPYGLNEIAILKNDSSSMITIHAVVNGSPLTSYMADGLIIATPTGSTGYSLSVGGPIIVPHSASIAITPVAPHSLNIRPIIIPDCWDIELTVETRSRRFLIAIDGRSETCNENTQLKIKKADYSILVVKQHGHQFFDSLRSKLLWGIDTRQG
jgi:NAD+ kinase